MRSHLAALFGASLGVACGGNSQGNDGPPPADSPVDEEPDSPLDEGGGTTIEYQTVFNAEDPQGSPHLARVSAFYWKTLNTSIAGLPHRYPLAPMIPGCAKTGMTTPIDDADDIFPWGMGKQPPGGGAADHTYQDVGAIDVTGGANPLSVPVGPNPGRDGEGRLQDGIWHFFVDPTGGDTFFDRTDALYTLTFGGSADWPAQTYTDAFYMPPAFALNDFGPAQLVADTDFVTAWTPPTPANLPASANLVFTDTFLVAGVPVLLCIQDNISIGQQTVPKELVNYVRSLGSSGVMVRSLLTHRVQELINGTVHTHKRADFIAKWGFVTPWTAP